MGEEAFLPLASGRGAIVRATQFRSTWLSSSLRSLRERALYDKYLRLLPSRYHDAVRGAVVGVWLPTEVAVAHYEACDGLGLSIDEQIAMGIDVAKHSQGTLLTTAIRLATEAGVTPWVVFGQFHRLWDRIWIGGGVGVYRIGPKEARVEVVGWPCARVAYCRVALRGVLCGVTEMVSRKAYVTEVKRLCTDDALAYRVAWA